MFFNKKPEQVAAPRAAEESLEWERGGCRSQSFRVIVTSWFVKTTPMLKYPGGCKVEVSFEGTARIGTSPHFPVSGDIEIPLDLEPPSFLSDHWENVPECVDGHASLSFNGVPQMFLTLYCTVEAMEWVSRVIVAGFSAVDGKAALDVDIGFPGEVGPKFWKEQWQKETLRVLKWDVRASAGKNAS